MARQGQGIRTKVGVLLVVLALGGGLAYALSRDDSPSAAAQAERQRSCARLFSFSSLVNDPALVPSSPTAPVRPEAVANLLSRMGGDLDLVVGTAPGKVRGDVRTLVDAVRRQSADATAMRAPAFNQARERLATFLNDPENACQTGSDSGSG